MNKSGSRPHRPRLIAGFDKILHGADYNPDQWLHAPEVIAEDFRLMKIAGCNTFSIGIFSWTSFEREEGEFDFAWLDDIMDRMAAAGHQAVLSTPSGAKPAWMSKKYPEVRRVNSAGIRDPHWRRHNHCWSSPVYREKVSIINTRLAERYAKHPALAMWHVSNELGNDYMDGQCHCELCYSQWHQWLEKKHGTLDNLNRAWWTPFWSHQFTAWDEIDPRDGGSLDGMAVDWLRFRNWQIQDWYEFEVQTLRPVTPRIPISTNFMGLRQNIDYSALAEKVDVVMDNQYPIYHPDKSDFIGTAAYVSFKDNIFRCFKPERPWMLIESCPDAPQWLPPMRPKPVAVHHLEMLQALGHGAEGTCYFQWRKGLGSREKLHGAIVDHAGREDGRVFRGVAELSRHYERLTPILGSTIVSEVGMIYDWEARWGFENSEGTDSKNGAYEHVACENYRPFWETGVNVDIFSSTRAFDAYKLIIVPQLWMLKPGVARRLRAFVEAGGTLVSTGYLGICDEANLCIPGGWPGNGLMDLFGIWNEENDTLPAGQCIRVPVTPANPLGLTEPLSARGTCAILHARGAGVVATYGEGQFAGTPAITVKRQGKGEAWYVGPRLELPSLRLFYGALSRKLALTRSLEANLPPGVTAQRRQGDGKDFVFVQNFSAESHTIPLGSVTGENLLLGKKITDELHLEPFGSAVLAIPVS
jgi:beta-galactosidase